MSKLYKQNVKKLLGHPDFGPVLASDVFTATASSVLASATHTSVDSWVLPRDAHIKGISIIASSGALVSGSVQYAVTHDGVVAASGSLPTGKQSDAVFVGLDRQSAVVASSGATLDLVYAVTDGIGTSQDLRLSCAVDYIGNV